MAFVRGFLDLLELFPRVTEVLKLLGLDEKLWRVLLCGSTLPLLMEEVAGPGDLVTVTPGSEFRDLELPLRLFPVWPRLPPPLGTSRWTVDLTLDLAAARTLALTKFFLAGGRTSALVMVLLRSLDPRGEGVCGREGDEGGTGSS